MRRLPTRCALPTAFLAALLSGVVPCPAPRLGAQTCLIEQPLAVVQSGGDKFLRFYGLPGRTYFLQLSDPEAPLTAWTFATVIEVGNGEWISYEVDGTPDRAFFRLHHTDDPIPAGTPPEDYDFDFDGMATRWELENNLDPLDGTGLNGPHGDPDGDGLDNFTEYLNDTSPSLGDTDGDGVSDAEEIQRGADPTDPADGGNPPEDPLEEVPFTVGGDYASWTMTVQGMGPRDFRTLRVASPVPGQRATLDLKLRRNNRYEVTLLHTESLEIDPAWYCWEAQVAGWPTTGSFEQLPDYRIGDRLDEVRGRIVAGHWLVDNREGLLSGHLHSKEANVAGSLKATLTPVEILADWNRDGMLGDADRGRVSAQNPWRFWVNDDDDWGETEGEDISIIVPVGSGGGGFPCNYWDNYVNGLRDLVDFFPLRFPLKRLLEVFPETDYEYRIVHDAQISSGSQPIPSFNVLWYPEALPEEDPRESAAAGAYLKNLERARALIDETVYPLSAAGMAIPEAMLLAGKEDKGVALLEGRLPTDQPLRLEIRRIAMPWLEERIELPVSVSRVEDMFRWKYVLPAADDLTAGDIPGDPPNWPDGDRNDKHFVFVHGYNVSGGVSRGWGAECFKRLFWSGSNARFSAFAWKGNQGQISSVTPNYQLNLGNAFGTAKSFKQFLDLIEGETTVAAHSMGNILAGSAMHDWEARPKNYLMLNAAAAKECYDKTEAETEVENSEQDEMMENLAWRQYIGERRKLRASEWHRLLPGVVWPASDWRSKLTWRDRLRRVIDNGGLTTVYNFYSSGEEVLNNPTLNDPLTNDWEELWLKPNKAWAVQEKRKGYGLTGHVLSSNYGGWKFNLSGFDPAIHASVEPTMKSAAHLPAPFESSFLVHLSGNPFFDRSQHAPLYDPQTGAGTPGSDYAEAHRNTLISEMIPCTTFAAGRNEFRYRETSLPIERDIDMNATMKTDSNEWPWSDANGHGAPSSSPLSRPWLHSDLRVKAFTHNWKLYEKFVEIGNLN